MDLSVAMAYSLLTVYGKQNRSLSAAAALLRGYNSVCPLTEVERKHLLLLMACRLSCSVTLGAYSYQQNPGNEYLLLHSAPAWNALELIWGTDPDRRAAIRTVVDGLFDRACSKMHLQIQLLPLIVLIWPFLILESRIHWRQCEADFDWRLLTIEPDNFDDFC